jgi:hypothetical protein
VTEDWKGSPHLLTYRQTERTFGPGRGRARQGRARRAPVTGAAGGLRRPPRGQHLRPGHRRQHGAGCGLDGPGVLLPPPAGQGRGLRRPRGLLGPPQEQPAAQPGRAVLRLLLLRRDHDARRGRPRHRGVRAPRHGVVVPARSGARAGARADRDARRRPPARRRAGRLRLRPPRR